MNRSQVVSLKSVSDGSFTFSLLKSVLRWPIQCLQSLSSFSSSDELSFQSCGFSYIQQHFDFFLLRNSLSTVFSDQFTRRTCFGLCSFSRIVVWQDGSVSHVSVVIVDVVHMVAISGRLISQSFNWRAKNCSGRIFRKYSEIAISLLLMEI